MELQVCPPSLLRKTWATALPAVLNVLIVANATAVPGVVVVFGSNAIDETSPVAAPATTSTLVQTVALVAEVPTVVRRMRPSSVPASTRLLLPGATAMALNSTPPVRAVDDARTHVAGVPVPAASARHSVVPDVHSRVFELGSRTKGLMN